MRARVLASGLVLGIILSALPAAAELDFSGDWAPRFYEDQPERVPGPELGDYLGLPINAAARMRAERALARPVTHAVVVLPATPDPDAATRLRRAAEGAGLELLRLVGRGELSAGQIPALTAAILAEDLAPRPELAAAPDPG